MNKAVFLDRDGVIVEDIGYLGKHSDIRFLPKVGKAVKLLNKSGFKVIVVTNQSGVARGYFTEQTVRGINKHIQESLAEQGAFIDRMYYCPHHLEGTLEEYRRDCHCRKPNPGMIEAAVRDFGIDAGKSFLIGDKISDIEAGHRAGCKTILLQGRGAPKRDEETASTSNLVAEDLYEAAKRLIKL